MGHDSRNYVNTVEVLYLKIERANAKARANECIIEIVYSEMLEITISTSFYPV